jgi:hypothetical protein
MCMFHTVLILQNNLSINCVQVRGLNKSMPKSVACAKIVYDRIAYTIMALEPL